MDTILVCFVTFILGFASGVIIPWHIKQRGRDRRILPLVEAHFKSESLNNLTISEREFPCRIRADLPLAPCVGLTSPYRGSTLGSRIGNGNSSGMLFESGASPRIMRVAAPVNFKYQSEGSPS